MERVAGASCNKARSTALGDSVAERDNSFVSTWQRVPAHTRPQRPGTQPEYEAATGTSPPGSNPHPCHLRALILRGGAFLHRLPSTTHDKCAARREPHGSFARPTRRSMLRWPARSSLPPATRPTATAASPSQRAASAARPPPAARPPFNRHGSTQASRFRARATQQTLAEGAPSVHQMAEHPHENENEHAHAHEHQYEHQHQQHVPETLPEVLSTYFLDPGIAAVHVTLLLVAAWRGTQPLGAGDAAGARLAPPQPPFASPPAASLHSRRPAVQQLDTTPSLTNLSPRSRSCRRLLLAGAGVVHPCQAAALLLRLVRQGHPRRPPRGALPPR